MTESTLVIIGVAIVGSGGVSAVVTAWIGKRGSRENQLIDQLQEMVDTQRGREKEAAVENRESQRREASLLNYIWTLQGHINSDQPPPPPAWPADLIVR